MEILPPPIPEFAKTRDIVGKMAGGNGNFIVVRDDSIPRSRMVATTVPRAGVPAGSNDCPRRYTGRSG